MKASLQLVVILVFVGAGFYGWHEFDAWKLSLIEQGKKECRDAVNDTTNKTLVAEAVKARDEAVAQAAAAVAETKQLKADKTAAAATHDAINLKANEDLAAAKSGKASCLLKDSYVKTLNAPLRPVAVPATGALK